METNNLIIFIIISTSIYAILSVMMHHQKQERYLKFFTYSFLFIGLSYFFLALRTFFSLRFGYALYSVFNYLSYVFIFSGLRQLFGMKSVDRVRLILILASVIALWLFSVFVADDLWRGLLIAIVIIYNFVVGIMDIKDRSTKFPDSTKRLSLFFLLGSMSIWIVRFATLVYFSNRSINSELPTIIFLFFSMMSVNLWFALTIWLDAINSMQGLNEENHKLDKIAYIDRLTGLANRYYLDYDLELIISTSKRNKSPIGMLLIDLDRFKLVNDIYGHNVGDAVLKQTADIITRSLRTSDRVYRWGGEEFLVVLPDTDREGMSVIADKINQKFRESTFDVIGSITVSIGGANYEDDEEIELWFKRVDLSLYKAKQTGRDRFNIWMANEDLPEYFYRIEWKSEMESGHKEIDGDHQLLFYYANDLHDSIINHLPIDSIRDLVLRMSAHLRAHFDREEAILYRSGFTAYLEHRAIHQRILKEYEIIAKKALNGEISLGALMSFLVEKVVIEHINQEDAKFFEHINQSKDLTYAK